MKNLLNLKKVQVLSNTEQKLIYGGKVSSLSYIENDGKYNPNDPSCP